MATNAKQKMLNTFHIDQDSEVDGRRYQGSFTTKKLSIRDLATLGVRKAQLNGGLHYDYSHPGHGVDEQTDEFNNMIAHLELTLTDHPDWWKLEEISDVTIVGAVYKEVLLFENSFLGRPGTKADGSGESADDSQATSQREAEGSDTAGSARAVVGQEVQAALEP